MIEDTIGILQQVVVTDPHNNITEPFEVRRPLRILAALLVMLGAIQFDDEHRLVAQEIGHERPARHLTPKLQIAQPPIAHSRP
jgi:hypothetical protein